MNRNFKKNIFGFTLIELIVTVTIIMILSGVGAVSLSGFNSNKELEATREEVANHIKLARNLAITKQLPNQKLGLDYVRVNVLSNQIAIFGVEGLVADPNPPYSTKSIDSKTGISLESTPESFGFIKSTGHLTDDEGNLVETGVAIEVSKGTDIKTININSLGVVTNVN